MKILARHDDLNIHMIPGDTLNLRHNVGGKEVTVLSHAIKEECVVDTALVIEAEGGELGLEYGIGGIFGKAKK